MKTYTNEQGHTVPAPAYNCEPFGEGFWPNPSPKTAEQAEAAKMTDSQFAVDAAEDQADDADIAQFWADVGAQTEPKEAEANTYAAFEKAARAQFAAEVALKLAKAATKTTYAAWLKSTE